MSFFTDFLAKVPAEDQTILNKYPELKASTEKLEADLGQVSRFAGEWVNWQNQNWDPQAGMTKREKALSDELTVAQGRLSDGIANGADAAALQGLESKFDLKLAEVQKQSTAQIEGMNFFYRAASTRMFPHQQEFKENLDPQKLMQYMQQNGINDPDVAYDKMVAPRRAENATQHQKELDAAHATEIQAAEQRGFERRAQESAMGPNGMLPTDHTGGILGVTGRIDKPATISDEVKAQVGQAKLGDGNLAALGYEMYRRGELPVQ